MLFPEPDTKGNLEAVAVTDPDEVASVETRGPSAVAIQVEALLRAGKLKEAESAILAVLGQPSKTWEYYVVLGQVYAAQKRFHEAREAYRHAVLMGPLYARPHFRFGEFLLRKGELREAEEELRTAIRITPNISDFHAGLAAVLMEQGWVKDARTSLRRSIRLDRKSARPRQLLGKLEAARGHYRAAEKSLAKAHALNPDSRSVLESLANVLAERGKTDQAIACTKKILALEPADADTHFRISKLYQQAGRLDEAEQAIRAALALEASAEYYDRLSRILGAQRRTSEAIAASSEACRLDAGSELFRSRLADLTAANGVTGLRPRRESADHASQPGPAASPRGFFERMRIFWARGKK